MNMTKEAAQKTVDEVFSLYEKWGQEDYIGEPVSQLEHMVQAAQLAESEGYDDEVILAAFFHDIGHLAGHLMPVEKMEGAGVLDHETIAADYLREKGFPEKICLLVASHVQAKRYLTYKYPEYYQRLSPASKTTLSYQGGVMTPDEAQAFEKDEWHSLYLKFREWDDKAKVENMQLVPLDKYRQIAIACLVR
jgi:phosphonate degradation associated HDIG domain protein